MNAVIGRDILQNWSVVVVDDEPDSLEVAVRILRYYAADVHTATNGEEGVELIRALHPKLVIADLSMSEVDGWEMLQTLKDNPLTRDIPVIALTAHAMPGDRERALLAGFHNYLTKPLTPATFMKDLLGLLMDIPALAQELAR
jgi:CheY-like chemotaxis protein